MQHLDYEPKTTLKLLVHVLAMATTHSSIRSSKICGPKPPLKYVHYHCLYIHIVCLVEMLKFLPMARYIGELFTFDYSFNVCVCSSLVCCLCAMMIRRYLTGSDIFIFVRSILGRWRRGYSASNLFVRLVVQI